jgi:hypothetical protein
LPVQLRTIWRPGSPIFPNRSFTGRCSTTASHLVISFYSHTPGVHGFPVLEDRTPVPEPWVREVKRASLTHRRSRLAGRRPADARQHAVHARTTAVPTRRAIDRVTIRLP